MKARNSMSLQFVIGSSGSGKSTKLFNDIIKKSLEKPHEQFIFIVPDQFTMETQEKIVELHPYQSVMNIDVLSFKRLAYKVFGELSIKTNDILGEMGKNLILRKIMEDKKNDLKIFKSSMGKKGSISKIRSLISEFSQYGIGPLDIEKFKEFTNLSDRFKDKVSDIETIYKAFNDFIEGEYITQDEILDRFIHYIDKSKLIKYQTVILDGFTGFTPIQLKVIRKIMPLVKDMYISLTLDKREYPFSEYNEQELFYLSKETISKITSIANEKNVDIKAPQILDDTKNKRYKNSPELAFLEQNLFRNTHEKYRKKVENINLIRTSNKNQELSYIASQIRELCRTKGYKYSDFLVISSDVEGYSYKVKEIFNKYKVPVFVDQSIKIKNNPLILFVKNLFIMAENNFKSEDVIRFFKCGCLPLSKEDIYKFEYYVSVMNFRGYKKYFNPFERTSDYFDSDRVIEVEKIRKKIMDKVKPFIDAVKKKNLVSNISKSLYELLESLDVPSYLHKISEEYAENKEYALAKVYKKVYNSFVELLDKTVDLFKEQKFSKKEYREIIDSGLDTLSVGVIPENHDSVIFGDIERTRVLDVKVIFLCGAYDGMIPKIDIKTGIISEFERKKLKENGVILSPTMEERAFLQRFYLYLYLTKASEKLYILSPKIGGDGASVRESYIYSDIMNMCKGIDKVKDISNCVLIEDIVNKETAKTDLIQLLSKKDEKTLLPEEGKILCALEKKFKNDYIDEYNRTLENISYEHKEEVLKNQDNSLHIEGSVSQLETYAMCPFRYFLLYKLGLEEWESDEFGSIDMGNFYHRTLELYAKKINEQNNKWDISEKESNKLLEDVLEEVEKDSKLQRFVDDEEKRENEFIINEIKNTLRTDIPIILEDIKNSCFKPEGMEVDFTKIGMKLDSLHYELSNGSMDFRGKIDRLDTYEKNDEEIWVKITDYKSSDKKIDASKILGGLDIQMFVYLDAALEYIKKKTGKNAFPAGVYYNHITSDFGTKSGNKVLESTILKKSEGVKNGDKDILEALAEPLKLSWNSTEPKRRLTTEEWKINLKEIRDFITNEGEEILQGKIDTKPYCYEKEKGCTYCPYHSICHFDNKVPGYKYRDIKSADFKKQEDRSNEDDK